MKLFLRTLVTEMEQMGTFLDSKWHFNNATNLNIKHFILVYELTLVLHLNSKNSCYTYFILQNKGNFYLNKICGQYISIMG